MFQILAACGALALEDTSGACGDCGPVDGPSGVDDGLHRFLTGSYFICLYGGAIRMEKSDG